MARSDSTPLARTKGPERSQRTIPFTLTLETFLKKTYRRMPRTMLRYAIERFGKEEREAYLQGRV